MTKLTDKQERFCQEFIIDLNGKQAAIRAKYSEATAEQQASRLLSYAKVMNRIASLKTERAEKLSVDAEYVLRRHLEIDQMDVLDILGEDGSLRPVSEWPKVWRQYLSGFDVAELWEGRGDDKEQIGVLKKIKWPDKVKNLELLGKHVTVQAYQDKQDVHHSGIITTYSKEDYDKAGKDLEGQFNELD